MALSPTATASGRADCLIPVGRTIDESRAQRAPNRRRPLGDGRGNGNGRGGEPIDDMPPKHKPRKRQPSVPVRPPCAGRVSFFSDHDLCALLPSSGGGVMDTRITLRDGFLGGPSEAHSFIGWLKPGVPNGEASLDVPAALLSGAFLGAP